MSPDNLYIIVSAVFVIVIGYDVITWLKDRTIVAPEIRLTRLRSKINGAVLILGSSMTVVSVLLHVNVLRYTRPIPFTEIERITLKDFKGYRRPYETLDGQKEFAFITTSLDWKMTAKSVRVQAVFHPARSYVYNDNIVDNLLLTHELYHFRIAEIFARRCRKDLSQTRVLPSDEAIAAIRAFNEQSEDAMQYRYDEESYHGFIMKEQKRWQKEIDSLLNLMDKYKNPTVLYE
jgi:hypothetical protein